MASVQQQITLTVTVIGLNLDGQGNGVVMLELKPTTQRFPPYRDSLTINPNTLKYVRNGVPVWDVSPSVLSGPGSQALAQVNVDIAAATVAGVFNI